MYYYENNCRDPYTNHALEEYFLNHGIEVFMLWQNDPSVLIGLNQNAYRECHLQFMKDNNINLVRRISGGGAIYTDEKNMQYTFITDRSMDFRDCAKAMASALQDMGIPCEYHGRNDIVIDGMKISGNAGCNKKYFSINHGTLLYDANMDYLTNSLNPSKLKFKDKAVKSVRKRVTFIKDYTDLSVEEFIQHMRKYLIEYFSLKEIDKNEIDFEEVMTLREKYINSEFRYGKNGVYNKELTKKHPWGIVEYRLNIENGKIIDFNLEGDFFADSHDISSKLIGKPFTIESIQENLEPFNSDLFCVNDIVGDLFGN